MRASLRSLGSFVLLFALALSGRVAQGAPAQRVHLQELARRLFASDKVHEGYLPFGEYFHQPKQRIYQPQKRAETPSPFERALVHFWKPEALEPRGLSLFSRKGPLPARFPWSKRQHDRGEYSESSFFRASILNAAATWADKDGYVDMNLLARKFGASRHEQAMRDALAKEVSDDALFHPDRVTWNHLLEYLDQRTLEKITAPMAKELVPKDMRALAWVGRKYDPQRSLGGVKRIWARQHVLGNTLGFLEATGLPAERMDVWGKVYSLDPRVAPAMTRKGYRVHGDGLDRAAIEAQVASELRKIPDPAKRTRPEFLLLDDGGELIEIVADYVKRQWPDHAHLFSAVEQTMGGINRLSKGKLPFSVVASGASWGKKEYGSAMFGYAVAREIETKLDGLRPQRARLGLPEAKEMTVLGYGEIGSTIAKHFRDRGFEVVVYDPDPKKREQARNDGLRAVAKKADALGHARILVSAAGRTAFRHDSFKHLPNGAIVFNAASSNELPRRGEREGGLPRFDEESYLDSRDTNRTLLFKNPKDPSNPRLKALTFVKNGGVINFPLEVAHPRAGQLVPGRYIQFQLGLLYLDIVHAMKPGHDAGFVHTPKEAQAELAEFVQADLAKRGESLKQPRWE